VCVRPFDNLGKIVPNVGHHMNFKVLADDIHKVIYCLAVWPADDPKYPNLCLTDLFDGEPP